MPISNSNSNFILLGYGMVIRWHNLAYVHRNGDGVLELSHPVYGGIVHTFDAKYLDFVKNHHWSPISSKRRYARTRFDNTFVSLHHLPWYMNDIPIPKRIEVDHKSRKSHDSRSENLHLVTKRANGMNRTISSKTPHVVQEKDYWRPHIDINGVQMPRPVIRDLSLALIIGESFFQVGELFDHGLISMPSRENMITLAEVIKKNPDNVTEAVAEFAKELYNEKEEE